MAVATLSPWPTTPAALTAARECLKTALGEDDDAAAQRLGSVAAELVERYAPAAPQPVKNEAVVRTAGWLRDQPAWPFGLRTWGRCPSPTPRRTSARCDTAAPWRCSRPSKYAARGQSGEVALAAARGAPERGWVYRRRGGCHRSPGGGHGCGRVEHGRHRGRGGRPVARVHGGRGGGAGLGEGCRQPGMARSGGPQLGARGCEPVHHCHGRRR